MAGPGLSNRSSIRWTRPRLVQALASLPAWERPDRTAEQVQTPPEAAAELLSEALARGDLSGRNVLDLGSGTGILAIGAALLGAANVVGVEADPRAAEQARRNALQLRVSVRFDVADVGSRKGRADTVLMNPPFGAQRRNADRPFWATAFDSASSAIYAFSLSDSRTFIEARAVERLARIEATRPVAWELPATFPHHRKRSVALPVDLWVLRTGTPP